MADLRCPTCGKDNPDFLDVCQFCQTPLKTNSVLRAGQTPTKKDTGELEAVLPDWLKNVRQQARTSAEEDAAQVAAPSKAEKEETPDFLAGLASQTRDSSDEELPDWLASMSPAADAKPATPASTPAPPPESDFFAQFGRSEAKATTLPQQKEVPASPEPAPSSRSDSPEEDDLSKWFARAAEQPEEVVELDSDAQPQDETAWARTSDSPLPPQKDEQALKEPEDLSWLHNLEETAKQTGDLQAPKQGADWMANFEAPATSSEPSGTQEDLSWLNNLGGIEASPQQAPEQPPAAGEDLSWLNNLGGVSEPQPFNAAPDKPVSAPPFTSEEDLSWLNALGGTPLPSQPAEPAPTSSSQEDLSWLNDLDGGSKFTPPFTEPESTAQSTPFQAASGQQEGLEPDWLKSALEEPSTPPSGDVPTDWFANQGQPPVEQKQTPFAGTAPASQTPQPVDQTQGGVAPFSDLFSAPSEPSSLSSQDVDSLFSVEMPDWLSRPEAATEASTPQAVALPPAAGEESLAPVDLPSWVQAMRPVEAVISETAPGAAEEPEEKEGALAGLRGVIPGAAIGLSKKPRPVSLKLQATNEQQASAALLEKILESETNPRALITPSFVASQSALRWMLTALFLLVLGAVIVLRSQAMQVSDLAEEGKPAFDTVANLPIGSNVLIVIDYEPALAGEMEAIGGPLLDQMTLQRNPKLSFISTSPNGSGLVERLMTDTGIKQPGQLSVVYSNLGYLPGGSAGVLGFMDGSGAIIPGSEIEDFSNYALLILMTDHAESGRIWVEQLYAQKQTHPKLANLQLVVLASAQAGPLLQPYLSSHQVTGMISGLSEAARYEYRNGTRPGIARSYWDAFGVGLMMAIILIVVGSLWSLITGIRARRMEAEQG